MRPVNRGACPSDRSGEFIRFVDYAHARPFLIDRLGDYCSFCEMPLGASLAVEHIRHKDNNPALECEWTNFLLACVNCNSTKGVKVNAQADVDARAWPHLHRTFEVLVYSAGGVVAPATIEDRVFSAKVEAMVDMVGLTRRPGAGLSKEQILRDSDRRYKKRREAWDEAVAAHDDLREADTPQIRRQILATARAKGFWSVWMTVFAADRVMIDALCKDPQYRGTSTERVFPLPLHVGAPSASKPSS